LSQEPPIPSHLASVTGGSLQRLLLPEHRFRAWLRPGWRVYLFSALVVVAIAAAITVLVYATGGTHRVYVHLGYLPVLVAGLVFGIGGGVVAGGAMGLLLGPYMPFDVAGAQAQEVLSWVVRAGFLVAFGVVFGAIFGWLRKQWLALEQAAYTDSLTGLPNSRHFIEEADRALEVRPPSYLYVLSVNSLSQVSASFGFQAMEEVLRQVAARLRRLDLDTHCVFRIHMGQFGVWAPEDIQLLPALEEAASEPVEVEGTPLFQEMTLGRSAILNDVTIGMTRIQPEERVSWAIRRAAGAAQWANETGTRLAEFQPEQEEDRRSRLLLLGELPQAMEAGQLVPYFHPKIDLDTGAIIGCEALVRWHHPEKGLVPPGRFIPYVEQSPLMSDLTLHLLRAVCEWVGAWQAHGLHLPVAVNASVQDMAVPETVDAIIETVTRRVDPQWIEIEVTEGQALERTESLRSLRRLREAGIRVAIDDYGTGFSSLSHLKSMPATTLKIDQLFVRNLASDPSDQALVTSTIRLGHQLGMTVIAEGVEDAAAARALRARGCNQAQGFLYTQPLPPADFEAFARNWTPTPG
jgi:EAL domain-containing protein (putative c-di-GMP-specific phosphodiesterase class I)/GGDEF domain-containing protein